MIARVEAYFLLWEVTRDRDLLDRAHRNLLSLHQHAREADRERGFARVALFRDVVAAWQSLRPPADGAQDGPVP